jgi:hypothetical protein
VAGRDHAAEGVYWGRRRVLGGSTCAQNGVPRRSVLPRYGILVGRSAEMECDKKETVKDGVWTGCGYVHTLRANGGLLVGTTSWVRSNVGL